MLNALLSALRRSLANPDLRAAYDEFLQRLHAGQVAEGAARPGDRMAGFLLPNAEGRLVDSNDLLARGPMVVTFFRGDWCPYCSATLDALERAVLQFERAGATLVALTPETGGRALSMKRSHNLSYEVLIDVDLAVAMAFGIVFRAPPLYLDRLQRNGVDLSERSGNPAFLLPVPATLLIDRHGVIQRTWVDVDFTYRAEPSEVVAALEALNATEA